MTIRDGWGWLILGALAISTIGDEITLITLMFRAARYHEDFAVPALLVAQLVPGLIVGAHAGRLVDRHDAAQILVMSSLGQAVVVALMVVDMGIVGTIIGGAVLGMLFAFSGTATFALIPVLGERMGVPLARANAGLEFTRSAGLLAGPVIGGILVATGGTAMALAIDAASFAGFAMIVWASRLSRPASAESRSSKTVALLADYRPLLRDSRITVMLGALTFEVFATAIADVAFVIGGAANSVHNVGVRTLMQRAVSPASHGKLAALYAMATRGATVGGFLAGGLFDQAAAADAYLVAGTLAIAAGGLGWWLFDRSQRAAIK